MYDAIKTKFMNNEIYCPEPEDLRYKICIMTQSNYDWSVEGDEINFELDMSTVGLDSAFQFTGGMAVRINNTYKKINQVFINGNEHFAFNDELVILPNLTGTIADMRIILADTESIEPHLTYISKRLPSIVKTEDGLEFSTLTKSKSKFSLKAHEGYLLINADGFNYSSKCPNEIVGYVNSDRNISLKKIQLDDFSIIKSTIQISDFSEKGNEITFKIVGSVSTDTAQIRLKSTKEISQILFDNTEVNVNRNRNNYTIDMIPFEGEKVIIVKLN
jgi:hypothetical protein